jgi:outer membrane protein W
MGAAAPAQAQITGDVAAYGSWISPQDGNNAYGGGAKVRFGFFEFRGTYFDSITTNHVVSNCPPFCGGQRFTIRDIPVEAGLNFKLLQNDYFKPYIGGGAGYYFLQGNNSEFGNIKDEFGWYVVGGSDFMVDKNFGFFAEAQYRRVRGTVREASTNDVSLSSTVPLQLGGIGINAGIVLHWM